MLWLIALFLIALFSTNAYMKITFLDVVAAHITDHLPNTAVITNVASDKNNFLHQLCFTIYSNNT